MSTLPWPFYCHVQVSTVLFSARSVTCKQFQHVSFGGLGKQASRFSLRGEDRIAKQISPEVHAGLDFL